MIAFEGIFSSQYSNDNFYSQLPYITSVIFLGAFTRRILSVPPKDKEKKVVEYGIVLLNNNKDLFLHLRDTSSPVNIM